MDYMFEFVQRLVKVTLAMFYIVVIIGLAVLIVILAVCLVLGWVVDWRLSLGSFPALCFLITIFDIVVDVEV